MARSSADNAAMESFFALLQKDVLDQQRWATRAELRLAIVTWIEKTYHRTRGLNRSTPRVNKSGGSPVRLLRKPSLCRARKPSRAGVALMSSSWASVRAASSPAVS